MDSNTLRETLIKLQQLSPVKHSVGVYSAENLPSNINRPAAIIVHSENSDKDIGHWLAIYLTKKCAFYFDSYGLKPFVNNHINFLKRNANKIYYNKKCYQAPATTVCGAYCLVFLASKMRAMKMHVKLVAGEFDANDELVAYTAKAMLSALGVGVPLQNWAIKTQVHGTKFISLSP
jgi:hypothetical protein